MVKWEEDEERNAFDIFTQLYYYYLKGVFIFVIKLLSQIKILFLLAIREI